MFDKVKKGDVIYFVHDDTIHYINELYEEYKQPDVAVLSSEHLFGIYTHNSPYFVDQINAFIEMGIMVNLGEL